MSLDQNTIEVLKAERRSKKWVGASPAEILDDMEALLIAYGQTKALLRAEEQRIQDYVDAIEKLKDTIATQDLAIATLRRRVESLEADRV